MGGIRKYVHILATFSTILVLFVNTVVTMGVPTTAIKTAGEQACGCRSRTWHGRCYSSSECKRQCLYKENAISGRCLHLWSRHCYCYFRPCPNS
uniref:Defensin-1 n=1 Tax=Ceanothus thyrsiflorus TaxID=48245 RepID=A0A3S8V2D7_CEATH|nr:defensin-1 [Ceanothus thyrsiflorus]